MKKWRMMMALCLMMALTLPAASANSWGLPGGLTALVTGTHDYDDYQDLTDDYSRKYDTARVIMTSRYHNQLIAAEKTSSGHWEGMVYSTTAVYQPSELEQYGYPKLTRTDDGFELSYPDADELYRFALKRGDEDEPIYMLTCAQMGDVTVARQGEYRYLVTLGEDSALWTEEIKLDNFNIHNMPRRGPDDVRRINEASQGLQYFASLASRLISGKSSGKKSYAVYAAPDTASYRAAKGKASVSTGEDYRLYCTVGDWSMIEYSVSMRTSRIGWTQLGNHGDETTQEIVSVPVRTVYDTYLTDAPNVSEYHQATLPAGTKLTALSHLDGNWAYLYVEATIDGQRTRGFVPQRDVVFDDVELPDEEAKCVGSWETDGGSEFWYQYLRLDADGRFYGSDSDGTQPYCGTWSVVQTAAGSNLYWLGDIPTIVFRCVNGTVYRYGLSAPEIGKADYELQDSVFCRELGLITCESGLGYVSYGVFDEVGEVVTDADGNLVLKELETTDDVNWDGDWQEEDDSTNG